MRTHPSDCLANPYTCDSPSPVPRPACLVVKNGSNTRSSVAFDIPVPVSLTAIVT